MNRVFYLMAATVLAASMGRPVQAHTVSIESYGKWQAAPLELTRTIQRHDRKAYQGCLPLQMLPMALPGAAYRVVTTNAKCHDGTNPQVWLVALGEKPRVLLADSGFTLNVGKPAAGLPELRLQYGDADFCGIRVWQYDGAKAKYIRKQTLRCA